MQRFIVYVLFTWKQFMESKFSVVNYFSFDRLRLFPGKNSDVLSEKFVLPNVRLLIENQVSI